MQLRSIRARCLVLFQMPIDGLTISKYGELAPRKPIRILHALVWRWHVACKSASQSTLVHFVHYAEGTHAYCAGGMLSYCTIISWWNFVPLPRCKNFFDSHLIDPQPKFIAGCAASKNGLAGYTFLNKILARFQHSYERAMPWAILEPNTNKCLRCRHCL